jgi:hypothetical protein
MQPYIDLDGKPHLFNPCECEPHEKPGPGAQLGVVLRTKDGRWIRGLCFGEVNKDVPGNGPDWQFCWDRIVYRWEQITLAKAAELFRLDMPASLIADIAAAEPEEQPEQQPRPAGSTHRDDAIGKFFYDRLTHGVWTSWKEVIADAKRDGLGECRSPSAARSKLISYCVRHDLTPIPKTPRSAKGSKSSKRRSVKGSKRK